MKCLNFCWIHRFVKRSRCYRSHAARDLKVLDFSNRRYMARYGRYCDVSFGGSFQKKKNKASNDDWRNTLGDNFTSWHLSAPCHRELWHPDMHRHTAPSDAVSTGPPVPSLHSKRPHYSTNLQLRWWWRVPNVSRSKRMSLKREKS